jgi:hypothetical protein
MRGDERFGTSLIQMKKWRRRKTVSELNAPNLWFIPQQREFDSEALHKLIASSKSPYIKNILGTYYGGNAGLFVEEVAGWYLEGF